MGGWPARRTALACAVALLVVAGAVALWRGGDGAGEAATRAGAPLPQDGPAARARPPARPRSAVRRPRRPPRPRPVPPPPRIEIPAIGVRAHVISLGLTRGRKLEVPRDPAEAGLWSGGARPGDPGAAVVVGHIDGRAGPAVFRRLGELRRGALVRYVHPGGRTVAFRVGHQERHPKDDFPTRRVYGATAGPVLRLVTCTGDFDRSRGHYRDNLIVFAQPA